MRNQLRGKSCIPGFRSRSPISLQPDCVGLQVTLYIAEFYNTISNILFVLLGLFGLWMAVKQKFETRFHWQYIGVVVIGIGSAMFHATLQYAQQQCDEVLCCQLVSLIHSHTVRRRWCGRSWSGCICCGVLTGSIASNTLLVSLNETVWQNAEACRARVPVCVRVGVFRAALALRIYGRFPGACLCLVCAH